MEYLLVSTTRADIHASIPLYTPGSTARELYLSAHEQRNRLVEEKCPVLQAQIIHVPKEGADWSGAPDWCVVTT